MMKNIFLQFAELHNRTYTCVFIVKSRMSCLYVWKLKLSVVFQKRNWNFSFAFEPLWLAFELLNLLFFLKLHPAALDRQLNYLECFLTMSLWQSNTFGMVLCHQSFLLHYLSLNCWRLFPFSESIWFFFLWFKKHRIVDYFSKLKCCVKSACNCFIVLRVSPSINSRARPWQYELNLLYARCCPRLRTNHVGCPPSVPNQDLLCVQQWGTVPFCENYAKFFFDAKHLEKELNRGWWNFWFPLFKKKKKNSHFGQYWKLPKFSRLDPVYHNI